MEKKVPGPNPYSHPLQEYFMKERFLRETQENYINGFLIQDRMLLEYFEIFVKNCYESGLMEKEKYEDLEQ